MSSGVKLEFAHERKFRHRNKLHYRLSHWPIWITVFFLAPGPLIFRLFDGRAPGLLLLWLGLVLLGTGIAGLRGSLPGVEPAPYILRFTEDRPNPLYRRVCYTMAWSELIAYAVLNIAGLSWAIATGQWRLQQIYDYGWFPLAGTFWVLGALGKLPRVKHSTAGEGDERRYFYGTVWAVCLAQPVLFVLWKLTPNTQVWDAFKLAVFIGVLVVMGLRARGGHLPRTRKIVPGEWAISD